MSALEGNFTLCAVLYKFTFYLLYLLNKQLKTNKSQKMTVLLTQSVYESTT